MNRPRGSDRHGTAKRWTVRRQRSSGNVDTVPTTSHHPTVPPGPDQTSPDARESAGPPATARWATLFRWFATAADDAGDLLRPGREDLLRRSLSQDPNDSRAFEQLVGLLVVRGRLGAGRAPDVDDVTWALAEETARNGRAWYPLIAMARLELQHDRETALRRMGTASGRDPQGLALACALAALRNAGLAEDALRLGTGHWRPGSHVLGAGREIVLAALEAGRLQEARRVLHILRDHPDRFRAGILCADLDLRLARLKARNVRLGTRPDRAAAVGTP